MKFKDYVEFTRTTAMYPGANEGGIDELTYLMVEVANESGELLGVLKKCIRGDYDVEELKNKVVPEMGDVMYAFMRLHDALGITPEEVMESNYKKLLDRKNRGKIKGSGDYR